MDQACHISPNPSWARVAAWGGGLAAALGAAGYGVWLTGEPLWGSLGRGWIPMASLTAFQFIIMGSVLWLLARRPCRGPLRLAAAVLVAACLLVSALALLAALTPWEFNPEEALFAARGTLGKIELNRMSPLTAALFLLAGASLLVRLFARPGRAGAQWAGATATLAAVGGALGVMGYLYGSPLLYGGGVIPMAASTSAAFFFLGCGLTALSGPRFILSQPLLGPSPRARILRAFLPLSVLLILGHGYLQNRWHGASVLNAALFSALAAILLSVLTVWVALRVARVIGRTIERTENELRRSQQEASFLADLIERSSQPWGIGYPGGRLGRCNQAFRDLLGYSREEMEAIKSIDAITPDRWREEELAKLSEMRQSGKPVRYEKQLIRKDGSLVPVELLVDLARDDDGEPLYYHAFITDITERKRAEDRFKILAEKAPFSIIQFDAEGRVTFVNKWHLEVFARGKLGREFFLGKLVHELPGTVRAGISGEIKKVLEGQTIDLEEVYFPRFAAGHEGYQKIHGMPFFEDGQVSGGVLIREDIEPRRNTRSGSGRSWSKSCCSRRRWRPSAPWPGASPTTSTTCWPR